MTRGHGRVVFEVEATGSPIGSEADALGLLYADGAGDAEWIAVPATCLDPAFFGLRSGLRRRIRRSPTATDESRGRRGSLVHEPS